MRLREKKLLKLFFISLFFLLCSNVFGSITAKPRHIYVIKTDHFDILFSKESEETAKVLADKADSLYELAHGELEEAHDLRIPVVISPDSDRLSVDYTPSPYNRIIIFEGVPELRDTTFQNALLGLFFHEVYLALSQSIRNPVNQFIHDTIGGDGYQPISLFYLPFSFVEGRAFVSEGRDLMGEDVGSGTVGGKETGTGDGTETWGEAESGAGTETWGEAESGAGTGGEADKEAGAETGEGDVEDAGGLYYESYKYGRFSDQAFLEILSLAKYEGQFPNWLQAGSARDICPGRLLNEAAGAAFSAYLMQTYGVDKYIEFWNKCGDINFGFASGMFKKVYGLYLSEIWKGFEESIPMPDNLEAIKELEKKTKKVFPKDREGFATNLIISDYGLIWYDDIRHEVDILDWNSSSIMRKMLFMASDVKKLSLSPDGRYLAVSFYGIKTNEIFRDDKVWIYDLQEREFVKSKFKSRDGVIVKTSSGEDIFAGLYVKNKVSGINFYDFDYDDKKSDSIYYKEFFSNEYPSCLNYAGNGKISYILSKDNQTALHQFELKDKKETAWHFSFNGSAVKIRNLRHFKTKNPEEYNLKNENIYIFEYYDPENVSFSRMGIILLDEYFQPYKVYFQDMDLAGGVSYPVILNNNLLFCSNRFSHNEIQFINMNELSFKEGDFYMSDVAERIIPDAVKIDGKKLGEYDLHSYNPLKYMAHMSFMPFMAIKNLATIKEQRLWPSLGGTFITQYDPFMNNRIMISGSAGYAKLDLYEMFYPTKEDITEKKGKNVDENKNISFGVSIENTATPVDIRAGALFKFNKDGEYTFKANGNLFLQIPIGMPFSKLNFSLLGNYIASTDYYDKNLTDYYPDLEDWPYFWDAYETGKLSLGAEYSNIHQSGISKYEERGFSLGINLNSFWNITEIKMLNRKKNEMKELAKKGPASGITEALIKTFSDEQMVKISQLIVGLYGSIKIPRLTPFQMVNGFLFSFPTTISAEVFNDVGSAVKASVETMLFAYEAQDGFPKSYLYFSRLGLKFGYRFNLKYDTAVVPLPDLRVKDNLWNVFANSYIRDSIYFIYNMDFCTAAGRLSEYHIDCSIRAEYFFRSKSLGFGLGFGISF